MRLRGKVAIVTGGGSGIGRATAELFAREGARVVVADFNAEGGQEVAKAIAVAGGKAIFVRTNVAEPAEIDALIKAALEAYDGIDILFNAAGVLVRKSVPDTDLKDWNRTIAVNLTGTFLCCRAALPHLIRRGGGSIINLSSSTGNHDACANAAAYIASKGGVTLLTKAMAVDHAKEKVRVNAICPGPTDTPMIRSISTPEEMRAITGSIPMGQLVRPEDVANAALYLASDESAFVTGATLAVDGGQTAKV